MTNTSALSPSINLIQPFLEQYSVHWSLDTQFAFIQGYDTKRQALRDQSEQSSYVIVGQGAAWLSRAAVKGEDKIRSRQGG